MIETPEPNDSSPERYNTPSLVPEGQALELKVVSLKDLEEALKEQETETP